MLQLNKPTCDDDFRAAKLDCRLLIQDAQGRILLTNGIGRDKGDEWMLPGGAVRTGEPVAQAVVRLAHELFTILVWPNCIVSVSDSALRKTSDLDQVVVTFAAAVVSGKVNCEQGEGQMRWCSRSDLPDALSIPAQDALCSRGALEFRT